MGLASSIRDCVMLYASQYESNDGIGLDAYCEELRYHPMADGKYLQACAVMREAGLISAAVFKRRVASALERLRLHALHPFDSGACWGLGFSHRQLPSTEPFLITSSIIARGLLDCERAGESSEDLQQTLRSSMQCLERWFTEWSVNADQYDIPLPIYSPGIREPIFNAASYAMGAMLLYRRTQGEATSLDSHVLLGLDGIRSLRVDGLGWVYAPGNLIVDLIHQCYILNALADVHGGQSVEGSAQEMIGQFATLEGFADALRLVPHGAALEHSRDIPLLRSFGGGSIELLQKVARLWSLGELLVLISHLAEAAVRREGWTRLGARVADLILSRLASDEAIEAKYPRHVMHAVHGLACYLSLLRRSKQVCSKI